MRYSTKVLVIKGGEYRNKSQEHVFLTSLEWYLVVTFSSYLKGDVKRWPPRNLLLLIGSRHSGLLVSFLEMVTKFVDAMWGSAESASSRGWHDVRSEARPCAPGRSTRGRFQSLRMVQR